MIVAALSPLAPGSASAAGEGCDLQVTGQMVVGLASQSDVDGVSHATEAIPGACQGAVFSLTGSNPGDDFDVCFDDVDGEEIGCSTASGDEAGTLPEAAVTARISYWSGVAGTYTFTASDEVSQGPVDLYLRTGPSGVGNADASIGDRAMSQEAPTKPTPSAWRASYAADGTAIDPNWVWAPTGGFHLNHADLTATIYFTAVGDHPTRGADLDLSLTADGEPVASQTVETPTFLPGEILEITTTFEDVSATGGALGFSVDLVWLNEMATAVLYDSTQTPARLSIGANVQDTQPPSQVTDVAARALTATSVGLTWSEADDDIGIDAYQVYRGTDTTDLDPVARVSGTSYIDESLTTGVTYHYRVSAIDVGGNEGPPSDLVAATPTEDADASEDPRPMTVVAIIDSGFNPYHYDFVGHQHPWNTDADATNDFDFRAHPATYIDGYPEEASAVPITVPSSPDAEVGDLHAQDQAAWDGFQASEGSGEDVKLHWIPGTKIVGAVHYGGGFHADNSAHGTRSAASAAGNIHGSCQACVFVLVQGFGDQQVTWAANQPWIDVVSNSWGSCLDPVCVTRAPATTGSASEDWRQASEDGKVIVWSAGNGLANAFVVPPQSYINQRKGADWIVKAGAVSPSSKQTYSGSGKPVDISSIGSSYPSTGGSTATGNGTHSGTSNAAPVTAGYLAKVLYESRELLGDDTPGPEGDGVVASGDPVACGQTITACALGDGQLTRAELRDLVFHNVQPDTGVSCCATVWPNTMYNHAYQGHGVLFGHIDGPEPYQAQVDQMMATATGDAGFLERPEGETSWFIMDSKCRQHLYGTWSHGYYDGTEPELDPATDAAAIALDTWCQNVPDGVVT